jgi:hypothetical protein
VAVVVVVAAAVAAAVTGIVAKERDFQKATAPGRERWFFVYLQVFARVQNLTRIQSGLYPAVQAAQFF